MSRAASVRLSISTGHNVLPCSVAEPARGARATSTPPRPPLRDDVRQWPSFDGHIQLAVRRLGRWRGTSLQVASHTIPSCSPEVIRARCRLRPHCGAAPRQLVSRVMDRRGMPVLRSCRGLTQRRTREAKMPASYATHRSQLELILRAWGMPEATAVSTARDHELGRPARHRHATASRWSRATTNAGRAGRIDHARPATVAREQRSPR